MLKLVALTVALVLAGPAPDVIDVERAAITTPDAGVLEVQGGAWLSDAYVKGYAAELADKREQNAHLRASAGTLEARTVLLVAAGALVVGLAGGFALAQLLPLTPPR